MYYIYVSIVMFVIYCYVLYLFLLLYLLYIVMYYICVSIVMVSSDRDCSTKASASLVIWIFSQDVTALGYIYVTLDMSYVTYVTCLI